MSTITWPDVLGSLVARADLTPEQASWAMGEILAGAASDAQIAGFAVALRTKGETSEELRALSDAMLAVAARELGWLPNQASAERQRIIHELETFYGVTPAMIQHRCKENA